MIKHSILVSLIFSCLPLFANADVITLEYTGHISSNVNGGLGHSIGDIVSGSLTIDLSKAVSDGDETSSSYWAPTAKGLVTSEHSLGNTGGSDFVDIYNGSHTSRDGNLEDYLWIQDARSYITPDADHWEYENMQLGISLQALDWITDLSLQNLNLNITDALALSSAFGIVNHGVGGPDGYGEYSLVTTSESFKLDTLKIISANVPEPQSILLMLIGAAGLFMRRMRV